MSHFNKIWRKPSSLDGSEFIICGGLAALMFAAFISGCNATIDQRAALRERFDRQRAASSSTIYSSPIERHRALIPTIDDDRFTSASLMVEP